MSEEKLPKGWKVLKFKDVTTIIGGGTPSTSIEEYYDGDIPWLSPVDLSGYKEKYISRGRKNITRLGLQKSSARLLPKNSVLFSSRAPIGYVAIADNEITTNQGFKNLLPSPLYDPSFAYYYLKHKRDYIESQASGTTFKEISGKKLGEIEFILPPLPEQQRIVAKLDALFGHLDRLREKLDRIPELLKNFRQQVLTQAVTGELTREWRENKDLKKVDLIKVEEERKLLKSLNSEERGKKHSKYKQSVNIDLGGKTKGIDQLIDLPESWSWVSIDKVVWNVSDGPHFSPQYVENGKGKRFISARNINYKGINFSDSKYVSDEDHLKFIERGKPESGDVILTKGGSTGIACIIEDDTDFSYWVHLALLKPIKKYILPKYLRDALASPLLYNQSQQQTHGVSNQDLGLTRLIYIALPFPSVEEQIEIVKRVEALFGLANKIESQYQSLKAKIDNLPQAILAKAFRGELVGQEVKEYVREEGELGMVAEGVENYGDE